MTRITNLKELHFINKKKRYQNKIIKLKNLMMVLLVIINALKLKHLNNLNTF